MYGNDHSLNFDIEVYKYYLYLFIKISQNTINILMFKMQNYIILNRNKNEANLKIAAHIIAEFSLTFCVSYSVQLNYMYIICRQRLRLKQYEAFKLSLLRLQIEQPSLLCDSEFDGFMKSRRVFNFCAFVSHFLAHQSVVASANTSLSLLANSPIFITVERNGRRQIIAFAL